jgi:ATP-dependent Clp endopeptidase proteolytic subunit ClpP
MMFDNMQQGVKQQEMKRSWYAISKTDGNNSSAEISIYDEIGFFGINAKDFITDLKSVGDVETITLRIHSPGGEILDGYAIFNALMRHPARIETHIDGLCASMATVIAMAGDEISMAENALFMIHNPWGGTFGEAEEMRKMADLLDTMKSQILSAYEAKTGKSREELSAMMDEETWLTANEAAEHGFIDTITEKLKAAANVRGDFSLNRFKKDLTFVKQSATTANMNVALEARITDLESTLNQVSTDLTTAQAEATELKAKVATVEASNVELSEKLTTALAEVEAANAAAKTADEKAAEIVAANFGNTKPIPAAGDEGNTADADKELYDRFQAANSIDATAMLNDPTTGQRIRNYSQSIHK